MGACEGQQIAAYGRRALMWEGGGAYGRLLSDVLGHMEYDNTFRDYVRGYVEDPALAWEHVRASR